MLYNRGMKTKSRAYTRNIDGNLILIDVPTPPQCPVRGCANSLKFTGEIFQANFGDVAWTYDCGAHRFMQVHRNLKVFPLIRRQD